MNLVHFKVGDKVKLLNEACYIWHTGFTFHDVYGVVDEVSFNVVHIILYKYIDNTSVSLNTTGMQSWGFEKSNIKKINIVFARMLYKIRMFFKQRRKIWY